jgi:hypothetical protein
MKEPSVVQMDHARQKQINVLDIVLVKETNHSCVKMDNVLQIKIPV